MNTLLEQLIALTAGLGLPAQTPAAMLAELRRFLAAVLIQQNPGIGFSNAMFSGSLRRPARCGVIHGSVSAWPSAVSAWRAHAEQRHARCQG